MPDFRCDASYLSRVLSELGITDSYSIPSTEGLADLATTINRFSPGKYMHDLREEIMCEAREIVSAADIVKRILSAEVGRMDGSIAPDFRTYALKEFGVDPRRAIAMVDGLQVAFQKAAEQMQIILPVGGKTSAAKPWHTYVRTNATVFVHAMATTNVGFVEAPNDAMTCRFLARIINDRGDGPVSHTAVLQFIKRAEAVGK